MSAVSVRDVVKRYGQVKVIHGLSLDIEPGEFIVFVGPSGCGKSTLLRLISGLDQPTGGSVALGPGNLGYVFQDATLLPWRTVRENVELFGELHGLSKAERREAAETFLQVVGGEEETAPA